MKHHAPQVEMNWGHSEPFTLVPEKAVDWQAKEAQAKAKEEDKRASEKQQGDFTQPGLAGTWNFWAK